MNWLHWSLLSAFFAGLTAVLAKAGVAGAVVLAWKKL
jgi:bacterial/archaeal transporter family protein